MRRHATLLVLLLLLTLATPGRAMVPGSVPNSGPPEQFYGAPAGWTVDADGTIASTFISSVNASGFLLFYCDERFLGFHIALSTAEIDQPTFAHDGLLQVYPALAQSGDAMLAHFTVRFRGSDAFHATRFRHPGEDRPARLLQLIRDYPTGLQLHATQLRHDRLTKPRRFDHYLPGIANENGVPMEIALAVVEETCRRPR